MKKIISVFLMCILLLSVSGCTTPQQKPRVEPKASSIFEKGKVEQIQIKGNNVPVRTECNTNSPKISELKDGEKCNVIGQNKDWYIVETPDGKVGAVEPSKAQPHVEAPSLENQQQNIAKLTPNEDEMVNLLNQERVKNGLKPLKVDMEVTKVARLKSKDMVDKNYFSHNSPTYGSPFDMLKKFGVKYIYAGENIAGNPSVKDAHKALMNSEGHRKNILNPNFTHIGIGVKEGSNYGKMYTQMFIGR